MEVMYKLKATDLSKLPYQLVAETTHRSIWNTGYRKRMMEVTFTDEERKNIDTIIQLSRRWVSKGAPTEVILTSSMVILWKRLGDFCYEL